MRPPLLLRRRLATQVVAVADGWPVLVQERHARETLGGERGPPTANSFHGGTDLTGVRVWEAAPDLIKYIDIHRARLFEGRSVIDLGSGTGAVGLSAAAFGAGHVVLSDIDSKATFATENGWEEQTTLAALAENAALNGSRAAAVSVAELRWGLALALALALTLALALALALTLTLTLTLALTLAPTPTLTPTPTPTQPGGATRSRSPSYSRSERHEVSIRSWPRTYSTTRRRHIARWRRPSERYQLTTAPSSCRTACGTATSMGSSTC